MPSLVAGVLARKQVTLNRVPNITDITIIIDILKTLGIEVERGGDVISISGQKPLSSDIPDEFSRRLRGSVYTLAIPAVEFGHARIGSIGGDTLGGRTLEPHARAFAGFGMRLLRVGEGWEISGGRPRPGEFYLRDRGVSATALAVLIAASIEGRTVIREGSLELEIEDVVACVRSLGAAVERDERTIIVNGPFTKDPASFTIPEDQIYCGTIAMASALTSGDIEMPVSLASRMTAVIESLEAMGVGVSINTALRIQGAPHRPTCVETMMYPGFPTDLLPQMMTVLTQASGSSKVVEGVYHSRYDHVPALCQMGASIKVTGNTAQITGPTKLVGGNVQGAGIRETAALLLASLAAQGVTVIDNAQALYRAYEDLGRDLSALGADVRSTWYEA